MESSALHVLVVAGSPEERLTLRRLLAQAAPGAYTITEADRADQVRSHCRANPPDCVLLAVPLPDRDARRFLADLRAASDVPVVLLTDVDHEALALDALQQGAQDYLVTASLTPLRLHLTLQRAVASARRPRERDHTLALLTALLDTLPVGVAVLDQELRVIRANTALATLLGAPAVALVRQPLPALWPTLAGPLTPLCAQALATGQPAGPLEVVAASPAGAGEPQAWQVGLYPLAMPGTGGPGLALVVGELTAQLEARTALALSEQRLRQALDAGGLVAWEWDIRAGIMTFSGAICDVLGFPPDRLTRTLDELAQMVYPPDRPGYAQALAAALRDGGPFQVRFRMRRDDQRLIWVEVRGVAQHDAGGQLVRAFGVTRDISAEMQRADAQALHLAISHALSPAHDVAATLQTLVRLPLPDLADTCALYLRDDAGQVQPTAAWTGDLAAPVALMGEPDRVTAVWRSGVPQLVADLPPPPGTEAPGPRALRSALLVPLTAQDHILGVLLLGRTTAGRPYAPEDLVLAEGLARRAAEALAQAQLREDRQAAEQAAAEVHARLEALITSLPSGIGYLDHELRYQLVNPALAALNGRTPEEHLGHALAEVLPGLAPQLEPLFGQVLATGEAMRDLELHGQPCSLDGAPHDWQISAFPVLGTAGAVAGVGVTVTDVTQRTRTAAALRASEERFRLLAEHAHDVLYRVRVAPTLALEYLSPAIARLTGYPREAFYGDITLGLQLVLPEDRPGFQQLLTGWHDQPPPAVIRWRHQDGAIRWAELHSWPVAVEAGQPVVFEGIARDITARKQAEEALRTSQENLASLIENTDGVIWSVDAQYRLIIANTRFYDLARAASGRTVAPGERILSSTIPADEQELRAYYDRALAGEAFSLELPTRVAAAPRIFAYRFGPIRTAAGAITGVTVIGLDSTERLQVAQALHDLERKLGTLFAILPVGISILDAAGDVVYANPALEQILQLDQASLHRGAYQARQYLRSDGTSMPAVEYASARALQAHQAVANLETGIVTEAGAVIWTSVSAAPVDFPDWHVVVVTTDITERKQAEAALRASEERLQLAMAGGNIGTFLWYPEADRGEPDARMLALCGLPADGALSLAVALGSLIHPDDRAGYAAALARATDPAGDGVLRAEMRLLPPDGSTRWLAITAQTFFAAAPPRAVRMSGIAADITERKQAEAALQASTAKLQAALESMTDAVFISDTDGRFLDFNDAFATFHKFRTKAECATTLAAYPAFLDVYLATGELVPLEQWVMPRALRGETGTNAEYTLRRKDTGETWVGSYSFAPIRDPAGAIIGAVIVGRDITAQHQTQRALAYERQQLAAVVRTMHEGVIAARPDGSLALINPADLQLRGLDPAQPPASMAELAQRTPHQLVGTEGQALAPEEWPLPRVLRGESFVGLELRVRSTRGEPERWLRFNGGPVYDEGGRLILGVVTAHDITQPKWDAAALAARTDTLSQTNAALTRALRLKDEFLAMMSHELRTPLNVVLGITEALNEELYGPISDRQRQALAQVTQSGRHLLAILSDILDLAQLEAGKAPLDAQPVDVDTLCRAALQFVQAPAQAKGIKLLRTVAVGVEGLRADARRLTQILVNLLDNAVKFTPQGGTVGLEVTGDGGQAHIQFVVWDTGIGIAEADFARLFQPFTQVDGRLSRQYGGIGLGLTLVHRLVDLHGGSISLASTPGQGSRFTVSLPWASADNVAPLAAQAAAPAAPSWAQPPRVLIADDHEPTLQFYADLLRQEGCEVVPARTGTEALAMVRAHQPDVAVVDIQMPGMDGLTAIRQIRADLNVARIPIIALTALAMPGDREHCLAAGATVYLAKPVGIRTLITTIADVLMGSSTGGIGE